jgi:hypothetical protein
VLTDPTTIKFKYITPAGTETTLVYGTDAALVRSGTGVYYVDLLLDTAGTWMLRWVGTGAATAADEFSVRVEQTAFASPL